MHQINSITALNSNQELINQYLKTVISTHRFNDNSLYTSVNYSLQNGGKRLRPLLFLAVINDFNCLSSEYITFAAAIELIHTYSLIHDDLPALDNDDIRRGQPTNHKVFGEFTAILAGDGLLTLAFELASINLPISTTNQLIMINKLAYYSGLTKMVLGQHLDLQANNNQLIIDPKILAEIYQRKTGALFQACIHTALIAVDHLEYQEITLILASAVGEYFQLQDDYLEFIANQPTSSINASKLWGVEFSLTKLAQLKNLIEQQIAKLPDNFQQTKSLIAIIINTPK